MEIPASSKSFKSSRGASLGAQHPNDVASHPLLAWSTAGRDPIPPLKDTSSLLAAAKAPQGGTSGIYGEQESGSAA
jgi:hypothetical protein